jgi:hypothetical protein
LEEAWDEGESSGEQDEADEGDSVDLGNEDWTDEESEKSFNGPDAEYNYELKDEREERKRELMQLRKQKEKQMEFEKSKEDEVKAAYVKFKKARRRARKKGKTMPIDSIAGQAFELFSSDYIDGCDNTLYGTKRAEFYCLDEDDLYEDDDIEISGTNGKRLLGRGSRYTVMCALMRTLTAILILSPSQYGRDART